MTRDWQDILGGALLVAGGVFVALYAFGHYDIGTVRRMGPGMFPMGAGVLLAILGAVVGGPAVFRASSGPSELHLRAAFPVVAGIAAFALAIDPLGLIPAVVLLVAIASFAVPQPRLWQIPLVAAVLCAVAYLLFVVALNLPLTLIRWPL